MRLKSVSMFPALFQPLLIILKTALGFLCSVSDLLYIVFHRLGKLHNALKAYAVLDDQVGYCQGMSYLCGCLNMYYSTEVSFFVFLL